MDDLYQQLNDLQTLYQESKETTRESQRNTDRIAASINVTRAAIKAQEADNEQLAALERRAWMRRVNRGGVWAGTMAAAGAIREAAVNHTGATASIGIGALTIGAGAAALAIGISGSEPPPIAGARPTISIPAAQPSSPSTVRPEPRRPESPRPPRVIAVPVRAEPLAQPERGGPPKAPPRTTPAPPAQPEPPSGDQGSSDAAETPAACIADIRVLAIGVRVLCR